VGRWLVHGGRTIKYVVTLNSAAGHKSHQSPPTDCPDEPLLLGHTKLESTVRYLGIEVEDALEMSEQTEI